MSTWGNMSTQDSSSPLMEQLIFFHDNTMLILSMITTMVGYLMITLFFNKYKNRLLMSETMEVTWTILPAITLIFIALPSLRLLYMLDEINNPLMTIKTTGHQWYWSYEYSDFKNFEFDSYMNPSSESKNSKFRLLDVDNRTILPFNTQIRLVVTAADVLHSWTISSLGVKIDATPGRLNQTSFVMNRPGLMFGQCSEICGTNHSFMPIMIESVNMMTFIKWLMKTVLTTGK